MPRADNQKKVLLALSGGVDSTVCAQLLQRQGWDVTGLYIRFSPAHDSGAATARTAAEALGIPFFMADAKADFEREVIRPFCNAYAAGRTPNPCVICNPRVKFATLCRQADHLGIRHIATGHYARVQQQGDLFYIGQAKSLPRDQSYMLYRLSQDVISRLLLPAGALEKQEIRRLAAASGLFNADLPDSQEICFIPDGDYAAFIERRGVPALPGQYIGPGGEDLGPHKGVLHYTIGQRRGLGLALGQPVFVKSIGANGDVHLAYANDVFSPAVTVVDLAGPNGPLLQSREIYLVKIRSVAAPVPAMVTLTHSGAHIAFKTPQRAPAPGQHAVLYQNGLVVGGGVIDTVVYD